jgi:hypothetical protein
MQNSGVKKSKTFLRAHSSGNCPGFSPDSLFTHLVFLKPFENRRGAKIIKVEYGK